MDTLKLKDGTEMEIKDFQPKNENLIKVRLHVNDGQVEGIWACLPDEFMEDYNNDVSDNSVIRYATLRNTALNLGPDSWGTIIPVKFLGTERPECDLDWINSECDFIQNKKETI